MNKVHMESPSFCVADSQVSFLLQSTVFLQESKSRQEAAMWSGGQERLCETRQNMLRLKRLVIYVGRQRSKMKKFFALKRSKEAILRTKAIS